jgi:hypothetical protein
MKRVWRLGLVGVGTCLLACGHTARSVGRVDDEGGTGGAAPQGGTHNDLHGGGDPAGGTKNSGGTSAGGALGYGGVNFGDPNGGFGNQSGDTFMVPEPDCGGCELVTPAPASVRGFAADAKNVYWIEHGTNNAVDEYNGDGRLVARNLDSGKISALEQDLPSPAYVGVSPNFAYIFLDNAGSPTLRRYPLAGGAVEEVAHYASPTFPPDQQAFATGADVSYFQVGNEVHGISEAPGATETLFVSSVDPLLGIAADENVLYFRTAGALYSVASALATPQLESALPLGTFMEMGYPQLTWLRLADGYFYATEAANGAAYVTRHAVGATSWKRLAKIDAVLAGPEVVGTHFFLKASTGNFQVTFTQTELDNPVPVELATFLEGNAHFIPTWCATRTGVYWATPKNVYFTPAK